MKFSTWLETVNQRATDSAIENLKKARDRIGQYTSSDFSAATDADATLRGVRGFLKLAHGGQFDHDIIFNLTRLANTCNHLSHLDPMKNTKVQQIQADIDGIISKLNH